MTKKRIIITGLGVLAPNGLEKNEFWQSNIAGKSGISNIDCFDTSKHEVKIAGEIKQFNPKNHMPNDVAKRADRFAQLGIAAATMAIEDSKLNLEKEEKNRIGISIGSGLGGILFHEQEMMAMLQRPSMEAFPFTVPKVSPNAVASWIALIFKIGGPNISITTACSSGTHGIGQGLELIRQGKADVVIAGGAEAPLTPFTFGAFSSLGVMSKNNQFPEKACRPFDRNRDGFVMGEGAGIVILEELGHALKREAKIYAELIGYGLSNSVYHMVIPAPDGEDAIRAMKTALEDAQISSDEVDYINAHGTATKANDKVETLAIKKVFGKKAYKIPVSSTKSMIGHLIGAAGAVELIVSILALNAQIIPPTINYETSDPECDLDYVPNNSRKDNIKVILSNSFGFGGNNACLVIKKFEK